MLWQISASALSRSSDAGVESGQGKPNISLAPRRITPLGLETDALKDALHLGLFQMKRSPGGTPTAR